MVNLLSSNNSSLIQPNSTSTVYSLHTDANCFFHGWSSIIFTTFRITYICLLLPLSVLILYQGLQTWRKNPSFIPSALMSHYDCFTYNTVIMQLIGVVGCIVCSCGVFMESLSITQIGSYIFFSKWYGEVLFHVLTCLERYIAVVHPITYLSLRKDRGIRIRNITVAFVWMLSLVGVCLYDVDGIIYWELSFLILALVIISFFSISCLCVLTRPGPGERGDDRKKVDQSKRRAFFVIVSTLGVLILRVGFNVTLEVLYCLTGQMNCVSLTSVYWFHFPSGLVLPIFFYIKKEEVVLKNRDFM